MTVSCFNEASCYNEGSWRDGVKNQRHKAKTVQIKGKGITLEGGGHGIKPYVLDTDQILQSQNQLNMVAIGQLKYLNFSDSFDTP